MEALLLITIFISFFGTFLILPFWIEKAKRNGLVGKDIHKKDKREVAEQGGINVLFGFALGLLLYIAINTFYFKDSNQLPSLFALLTVVLIAGIVGMVDDILGWKKGLSKRIRFLVVFFAAVPLMAINAGDSSMTLPFIGVIKLGIFYPLLFIPIGVMAVTTSFNFIAGYNGLEASQGIILLSALGIVTYLTGNAGLSIVALCMVSALFAFYIFNQYPARVFPGDIMTYSVGALIAAITILGNIEKIAIFFFIPYILEVILKLRGRLKMESFGKLNSDGSLDLRYNKIYGIEHLAIVILKKVRKDKKAYEKDVVFLINGFQIAIILLGFLLFL